VWKDEAERLTERLLADNAVLLVKGARVSDFGGRSIGTTFNSTVLINPQIPQKDKLISW
jgi:replication factor A1